MKKYLNALCGIMLCLVVGIQYTSAQGKQKISVLYVGGSAEMETMGREDTDGKAVALSVKERMASFEKFLKSKFRTVKVVEGKEYTAALSDQYDVTIFDGLPTPIRPKIHEMDKDGRTIRYERAAYLPDDFDRPALCIASASREIGSSIGSKCDWFCLCLFADAHHWQKDHPIFQGPFKVKIQSEMKPTPEHAYEYAKLYGYTLPDETEMWTVQNTAHIPEYRIGMVSRPEGFLDSPETEIISSGHCAKSIDAVAIGRHANFFHWGFSGSPAYMTEAGKAVFANAIVYISQFAGQHVIARKLNEQIPTRKEAEMSKYLTSREALESMNQSNREFRQMVDSVKQSAIAKQKKGEDLNGYEKMYLNYPMDRAKEKTYAEYMKERFPNLYHIFGNDASEYQRYYEKNKGWFYPSGYSLDIDEDVRNLEIANNDIRLLETCISMLEKNEQPELATRVLHRYTLCRFATPAEWRKWFDTYRDKMFFTESGGWLWLINTQDRSIPGNDYKVLKAKKAEQDTAPQSNALTEQTVATNPENPVAVSASIQTAANGNKEVIIRMTIHTGYHTYAQIAKEDPFIPTTFQWELPEGYQLAGELKLPAFTKLNGSETTIYEGTAIFRQTITGTGNGEIKCTVSYQCCDESICLPPAKKTLSIKVE